MYYQSNSYRYLYRFLYSNTVNLIIDTRFIYHGAVFINSLDVSSGAIQFYICILFTDSHFIYGFYPPRPPPGTTAGEAMRRKTLLDGLARRLGRILRVNGTAGHGVNSRIGSWHPVRF